MHSLVSDIRFALRMMRRGRTAAPAVALTLALGIAGNATIFTAYRALHLRPLPFEEPEKLVVLLESHAMFGEAMSGVSPLNLRDWGERSLSFQEIAPYALRTFNLFVDDRAERLQGANVSATLFLLLGVEPFLGRNFSDDDGRPGGPKVALLSYALWQRRFQGESSVLGRTIRLDDQLHEIVGVMPPRFRFPLWQEVWTPLVLDPSSQDRSQRSLFTVVRLAPGVTLGAARVEMQAVARSLEELYPETNSGWGVAVRPLREIWMPKPVRTAQYIQLGAVALVLLMVCANVSNLILVQAAARRKENAVRIALGAGRMRLVRQALTESTLLALFGGVPGVLLTVIGVRWMESVIRIPLPFWIRFDIDGVVLLYILLLTLGTGFVVGLAPILRYSAAAGPALLKPGGSASETAGGGRLRNLLAVAQIAISLVLMTGALLLVKSFLRLQKVQLGYAIEHVLTLQVGLTGESYSTPQRRSAFIREALTGIGRFPAVEAAGAVDFLPANGNGYGVAFQSGALEVDGLVSEPGEEPRVNYSAIFGDYLQAMEIPLLRGRRLGDGGESTDVLVNRSLAEALWPGENPIGRLIRPFQSGWSGWWTVAGVVGDIEPGYQPNASLTAPRAQVYVPFGFDPPLTITLVVRSHSDPARIASSIREKLRRLDPTVPVFDVVTMSKLIARVEWMPRWLAQIFAAFAGIAVMIAVVGVYGVNAYSASQRTYEIGVRLTLGARPDAVVRLFLRQALALAAIGASVGLAGAFLLSGLLSALLFEVSSTDPLVFGSAAIVLIGLTVLASYLPARRAARINPMVVLRNE